MPGSGGKCTSPSPFPILLIPLALLFQVPGTVQSGKLLSTSGREEGHGLIMSTSSSFLQSLRGRWEWFLLFLLELGFTFLFTINALWQMTGVVADSLFPFNKWLLKGNFR